MHSVKWLAVNFTSLQIVNILHKYLPSNREIEPSTAIFTGNTCLPSTMQELFGSAPFFHSSIMMLQESVTF